MKCHHGNYLLKFFFQCPELECGLETMSTGGGTALHSSRLLPKIVHPASQLSRDGRDKITVEVRKLTSAAGSRSRPHSCPEMSVDQLINSSRMSSRLRQRTCSARQQRGLFSAGHGHRLPHCLSVDEVSHTSSYSYS